MQNWKERYADRIMSAEEAVRLVKSGDRVWVGLISSVPFALGQALWERRAELSDVSLGCGQGIRPMDLLCSTEENPFRIITPFLGPNERKAAALGRRLDYTSFHLSRVDEWMDRVLDPDVALLAVSRPDEQGNVSLGPCGCVGSHAFKHAKTIIMEINPQIPYVTGMDALVPLSAADAITEVDTPIPTIPFSEQVDPVTQAISDQIIDLIPDGATIQLGIGGLSNAIGVALKDKNDLGIHSEMLGDSMMHLIRRGNVTNRCKGLHDGISVYAFGMGTPEFNEFLDHNDKIMMAPFPYVNDPRVISQCRKVISINTAMAFDLYGEVAADSLGWKQQSAVGGQVDFVRGSQWSEGGKSIIATNSCIEKNGVRQSKISLTFPEGTAVTTPRSDVQYLATEYGCVNLRDLTMSDRVRAVISLAHPDFRDELTEQAKAHHLL